MVKILHLDMDSFFASAEQQARPSLRGRPIGLSIAPSRGGTIIAASLEAKRYGVGTGSRVGEARALIPDLVILPPNPARYRAIHRRFRHILSQYTPEVQPRSIDEVAAWFPPELYRHRPLIDQAAEIKQRIRDEIGEWLGSSIGIGANWWQAKTGSGFDKPDGLIEITPENTRVVLSQLALTDLCGIARRLAARLQVRGIRTPLDLYDLPPWELKRRLGIIGYYWHLRVHGHRIDTEDHPRRTMGHSSVVPRATHDPRQLKPLLHKLVEKVARRLRRDGWLATALSVYAAPAWERHRHLPPTDDARDLFRLAWQLFGQARPGLPVRKLAVTSYDLRPANPEQLSLFDDAAQRQAALGSLDAINDRWGELTIHPAGMLGAEAQANDSIAFGQDMAEEFKRFRA